MRPLSRALAYLEYARCAFQKRAAYRLANWTGIGVNFFFFLVHAQVYLAFFGQRESVGGWRPADAVLYFACSESLLMVLAAFPEWTDNLGERVRSGDVAHDLARPISLVGREIGEGLGRGLYYGLARFPLLLAACALAYGAAPPLRWELLLWPLSLVLGMAVAACLWFLAHSVAFWAEHNVGSLHMMLWPHTLFGGFFVPIDFFPPMLLDVANLLPFRAALYTPVAILSGHLEGAALAHGLLHQLVWLGLLFALGRRVELRGVRHVVAHGG